MTTQVKVTDDKVWEELGQFSELVDNKYIWYFDYYRKDINTAIVDNSVIYNPNLVYTQSNIHNYVTIFMGVLNILEQYNNRQIARIA